MYLARCMYISDFNCINGVALAVDDSLIHLYADDTILYTSGPSFDTSK
jgi:hypothetical protein